MRTRKLRRVGSIRSINRPEDADKERPDIINDANICDLYDDATVCNGVAYEHDISVSALDTLQTEHDKLLLDFRLVKEKYDDLKKELHSVLWNVIPSLSCEISTKVNKKGVYSLSPVNSAIFETETQIGKYCIGNILGVGQFATVREGFTRNDTNKRYAVKIVPKRSIMSISGLKRVQTEINVLSSLGHTNIVNLIDVIHASTSIYIITEMGGNDLFEFFESSDKSIDSETSHEVMIGLISAIVHMHQHGYCHRDIKPENILLEHKHARCISSNDIKICDFGQCATGQVDGIKSLSDLCGSPGFFAPEMILDGNLYCGIRADIWSIGCVLLELALGHEHYCHNWMNAYDKEVLQNENVFKDRLTTTLTEINALKFDNDDMGNFLKRLLVINPDDRMRSNNLIHDKWLCGKDRCPSRLYASSSDESTDCADSFKIDTACVLGKKNLEQIKSRDRKSSLFHSSRDSIEARKRCSQRHHKILGRQREICLPPIGELKLNTSNTTK